MTAAAEQTTARYGNRRFDRMYRQLMMLEQAIRAHDAEATEAAWDDCRPWIDAVFTPSASAKAE